VTDVTESEEPLLTTAQAAKRLGISTRTLVRYAERGWITPAMRFPTGHRRWRLSEIREQLKNVPPQHEGDDR
jgi:excisionase family DNA binding protein